MIDGLRIEPAQDGTELARVAVIGTSCAGKTTFAQPLARALNFPHIELDPLPWQPNWVPRPPDEFRALTAQALSQDYWVTDGNYGIVRDLVWSRATTVVWLNYAFPVVLWRALARTLRRALTKEELFAGNRESLRMAFFSRESILVGSYDLSTSAQAVPAVVQHRSIPSAYVRRIS